MTHKLQGTELANQCTEPAVQYCRTNHINNKKEQNRDYASARLKDF